MNIKSNMVKSLLSIGCIVLLSLSGCKKDSTSGGGSIEYTFKGMNYKQTDNVSAVIVGGKLMGITDDNLDAKVGDSEMMATTAGSQKTGCGLYFKVDGDSYGSISSVNQITITFYDGTTIRGTFSGRVCSDPQISSTCGTISGSFQTSNITNL